MAESASPPRASRLAIEAAALAALALTVNLAGNGRVGLWDRDEPRYAQCAREMRASGDYLRPTFNGQPRHQKPVLIYWLMTAGASLGGDNPFGARLASSVAGAASCLLIWGLGASLFGVPVGRVAALAWATAPIAVANSKLATTDATLALLLLSCQGSLWRLSRGPSAPAALTFWAALALATLTKGPVGPALIIASGLAARAFGGPSSMWGRLRWRWGVPLFLAIAAPWYVAIGFATGWDFYREALGTQLLHRAASPMEDHGGFPGYYPLTSFLGFYPWSALFPAAVLAGWVGRRGDPRLGFLLGWAIGPVVLLECVRTKLVHYALPSVPAWCLLVGWLISLLVGSETALRRWPLGRVASGLLAGVAMAMVIACVGGSLVLPWSAKWPCLLIAAALAVGTGMACEQFRSARPDRACWSLAGSWSLAWIVAGAWLLPSIEPLRLSRRVAASLEAAAAREGAAPILAGYQEPSLVYAHGRPIPTFRDVGGLVDHLRREGAAISAVTKAERAALVKADGLELTLVEPVSGFNASKGRSESLEIVVLRATPRVASDAPPTRR